MVICFVFWRESDQFIVFIIGSKNVSFFLNHDGCFFEVNCYSPASAISLVLKTTSSFPVSFSFTFRVIRSRWRECAT